MTYYFTFTDYAGHFELCVFADRADAERTHASYSKDYVTVSPLRVLNLHPLVVNRYTLKKMLAAKKTA